MKTASAQFRCKITCCGNTKFDFLNLSAHTFTNTWIYIPITFRLKKNLFNMIYCFGIFCIFHLQKLYNAADF